MGKRLQEEVQDITLKPQQWLELLQARTTSYAAILVSKVDCKRDLLSPSKALKYAWELLDKRYKSENEPSQVILQQLTTGGPINASNVYALTDLASDCFLAT